MHYCCLHSRRAIKYSSPLDSPVDHNSTTHAGYRRKRIQRYRGLCLIRYSRFCDGYHTEPMRHNFTVRQGFKIMIIDPHDLSGLELSGAIKIADQFFFLTSILITGLPWTRYSSLMRSMFLNCSSRCGRFFFPASTWKA